MEDIIEQTRTYAEDIFTKNPGSHDWDHVLRVYNLASHIAKCEKADLAIVKIAALLHDIGRFKQDASKGKLDHAEIGSKMAATFLAKAKLGENNIDKVVHCIKTHRKRNNVRPMTLEAKVLFDADKLDGIGAIGIGRAFVFAGQLGARVHNPEMKLEDTKEYSTEDTAYREYLATLQYVRDQIYTNEGRRLANERHEFMVSFFDRLNQEVKM